MMKSEPPFSSSMRTSCRRNDVTGGGDPPEDPIHQKQQRYFRIRREAGKQRMETGEGRDDASTIRQGTARHHKRTFSRVLTGLLLMSAVVAADQLTKYLAWKNLKLSGRSSISLIPGVLELRYLENRGAAFGMLQNRAPLFVIFALAVICFTGYYYMKSPEGRHYRLFRGCMVFLAAGAAGNLVDRLFRGYVIDFIYFVLIDFPVFNVADICVSLSVVIFVIDLLFNRADHADWLFKRG